MKQNIVICNKKAPPCTYLSDIQLRVYTTTFGPKTTRKSTTASSNLNLVVQKSIIPVVEQNVFSPALKRADNYQND